MMIIDCIICLVLVLTLCTDCFPNPCEDRLSVNYEKVIFACSSGRFCFSCHVLKVRSYKIIFVGDVTSWIKEDDTICFTYLMFYVSRDFMFSVMRNFCSSAMFLIFVLFTNGCLGGVG